MSDPQFEDPAHEFVSAATRTALMAAAVAAEQLARFYRNLRQRAKAQEQAIAEQRHGQYRAARQLAWTTVQAADQAWMDRAEPDQVAAVWQVAATWSQVEPETFGPPARRVADLIKDTYGVDVNDLGRDVDLARGTEADPRPVNREPSPAEVADRDTAETVAATAGVDALGDQRELGAAHSGETAPGYDTDARREQLARRVEQLPGVDQDTASSRVRASYAQGRPTQQASSRRRKDRSTRRAGGAPTRGVER